MGQAGVRHLLTPPEIEVLESSEPPQVDQAGVRHLATPPEVKVVQGGEALQVGQVGQFRRLYTTFYLQTVFFVRSYRHYSRELHPFPILPRIVCRTSGPFSPDRKLEYGGYSGLGVAPAPPCYLKRVPLLYLCFPLLFLLTQIGPCLRPLFLLAKTFILRFFECFQLVPLGLLQQRSKPTMVERPEAGLLKVREEGRPGGVVPTLEPSL
jgi:hypothetical protein